MKITAIIEKEKESGHFSIYCNEMVGNHAFGGYGNSLAEAKEDFNLSISEAKAVLAEAEDHALDNLQIEWKYDIM